MCTAGEAGENRRSEGAQEKIQTHGDGCLFSAEQPGRQIDTQGGQRDGDGAEGERPWPDKTQPGGKQRAGQILTPFHKRTLTSPACNVNRPASVRTMSRPASSISTAVAGMLVSPRST